jgi:hypothetical protein
MSVMGRFCSGAPASLIGVVIALAGCSAGRPAAGGVGRVVVDGQLRLDVVAVATGNIGEVCVDLFAQYLGRPAGRQHECGASAIPPPPIGGYSATVLATTERAFLWGLTGPTVAAVGLSGTGLRVPVDHVATPPSAQRCCGVFILAMPTGYSRTNAVLEAFDADQRQVGDLSITIDGMGRS